MIRNNKSERTLILGTGPFAQVLAMEIGARSGSCNYDVVGMVGEDRTRSSDGFNAKPMVGYLDDLQDVIVAVEPDCIVVALSDRDGKLPARQLIEASICRNIFVEEAETVYEKVTGKLPIEELNARNVVYSDDFRPRAFAHHSARWLSLAVAAVGTLALSPLFLLIAILIKLDSRGSVCFVQERIGLDGKSFKLFKFRTMHPDEPDKQRESEWAGDNAHRVTRVGKWLRKFRLDELPQFFNILSGDMNIVGPRPLPETNIGLLMLVSRNIPDCGTKIPYYSLRSRVRPGITGWAQVRYRYANNLKEEIEKLRFDLYYVKHCSLWLDLRILFETVAVVFMGRESKELDNAMVEAMADTSVYPSPAIVDELAHHIAYKTAEQSAEIRKVG